MKTLIERSFWEEVIVYNTKRKNGDIKIEKCSMLLKLYFHFLLQLIFFFFN